MKKTITVILTIILIFSSISLVFATTTTRGPIDDPNAYNPTGSLSTQNKFNNMVGLVLGTIRTIGIVISVLILMVLGIKYMVGSVEERADFKKAIIPYIVAMILIAATSLLPDIIYKLVQSIGTGKK